MHGRIAADGYVHDVGGGQARRVTKIVRECIDGSDGTRLQLGAARAPNGGREPADDVAAPGYLRILDCQVRNAPAAFQVDEKSRRVGRSEVDGKTEARPVGQRDADRA